MPLDHNLVKTWFVSRAKPFSFQFAAWIDACLFKGEKIPITDIEGLDVYFGSIVPPVVFTLLADGSYTIPAGYSVYQMYMTSTDDATVLIGTEAGFNDLVDDIELVATQNIPVTVLIVAQAAKEIFFTGINSSTRVVIYLHKI